MEETILLIGSPGTGKSKIFNTLIGSTGSQSGVSSDIPTESNVVHRLDSITYIDTPDVDNISVRNDAHLCIEEAIQASSAIKIFFLLKPETSGTTVQDITIVNLVIDSLERIGVQTAFHYSVIFNQRGNDLIVKYEDPEFRRFIPEPFQEASPLFSILVLRFENNAYGKENVLLENQSTDINSFVEDAPAIRSSNLSNFVILQEYRLSWAMSVLRTYHHW